MRKVSCVFAVILLIIITNGCGKVDNEQSLHFFAGYEITNDEIDYFKTELRTDVVNYFSENYTITDYGTFWTDTFDGVTPTEYLETIALESAEKSKAELIVIKSYGIYEDISFSGLKDDAEQYNREHEGVSGTVGLTSIDMTSFYSYYIANGRLEAINIILEQNPPTQAEIDLYRADNNIQDEASDTAVAKKIAEEKYYEEVEKQGMAQ